MHGNRIRVGIIGALGYGGGELVRILSSHPGVDLTYLSSELETSVRMSDLLPNLRGFLNLECEVYSSVAAVERCDVVFIAQHAGWAMKHAGNFIQSGLKVIDLGADYRLRCPGVYEEWYKLPHESPDLLQRAVYGLPELYKEDIAMAQLIANPGCYPTGAILALAPLLKEKLIDPDTVIIDAKTGVSGAGRMAIKLEFHFPELNQSMKPYNVAVHRHTPEIEQELGRIAGCPITISFTPHLIPVTRGILTTAYSSVIGTGWTTEELVHLYREFYKNAPFVVILDVDDYPATKHTFASNFCHIGVKYDPRTNRVVVMSAIDNLVKGMAGQAVQNLNIMFGFDEKTGLNSPGICP